MDWIEIPDWDAMQHSDMRKRKSYGSLPWLKLHTALQHDDNWLDLTPHRRAILVGLWLEYAASRGRVPHDTAKLSRRLALRVTTSDLVSLNEAGWIEFRRAPRPTREEKSIEEQRKEENSREETQTIDFIPREAR